MKRFLLILAVLMLAVAPTAHAACASYSSHGTVGYNPIQPNPPLVQGARYGCASGACGGASATCGSRGAACHAGWHFHLFGRRRCH